MLRVSAVVVIVAKRRVRWRRRARLFLHARWMGFPLFIASIVRQTRFRIYPLHKSKYSKDNFIYPYCKSLFAKNDKNDLFTFLPIWYSYGKICQINMSRRANSISLVPKARLYFVTLTSLLSFFIIQIKIVLSSCFKNYNSFFC